MAIPVISPLTTPVVFISSQIKFFLEERKRLSTLIEDKFRWKTYLFEDISRPHPPRGVYKAAIEQSQIFIGIYGTEYGWIDKDNGMEISGIHDEWRIATEKRKPRLAFVQDSKEPRDTRLTELIEKEINKDITSITFDTQETLYRKVKDSLDILVNEYVFAGIESYVDEIPDYSESLILKYKSKYIIETFFFRSKLYPLIESNKKIYLYGEQGSGKTIILMLVAKKQQTIYISLRNRPLLYVVGYITNRVLQLLGKDIYEKYASVDDALTKCERLLRNEEILLIIDDVDQNIDVASVLLGLEIGKSKVIFVGRKRIPDIDVVPIECTGFTVEESESYVSKVAPNADTVLRREAIGKSNGNPLYLAYYCSNYDQKPPDSLDLYHSMIYQQLPTSSQEILAVLSISETLLDLEELAIAISKYRSTTITGIALKKELDNIDFLISIENGMVAILHPAFREYVCIQIMSSGVSFGLHKAISEVYVESGELHFRAYHLVCAGEGDKIYDDLPNAEILAYLTGYIRIARKLFAEDLLVSKRKGDFFRLGFALYHTALVKKDRYGNLAGLRTATLAKKIFNKAKKPEWVVATESNIATFLVNLNKGYEAVDMLKELAQHFKKEGLIHQEAIVRTNLSYVYAKLGRIDELEVECLRAKELHKSINDIFGIATCLLNLNNVHIARNQNEKLLQTCRKILKLAKKLDRPRLEAGAQNGLTAYYRRKEKYGEAEEAANKSISIAKQLDDWDCVATNYGNLGNVFRDQKKFPEAKDCHRHVTEIGRKRKSTHHIAHAKGRLAEIAEDEGDEKTALQLGKQSIDLWNEVGNVYEGASEKRKQAERILRFSGFNWKDAVKLYEEAIDNYFSSGLRKDAYYSCQRLIEIHLEHLERVEAAKVFHEAVSRFATPEHSDYVSDLLKGLSEWDYKSIAYLDAVFISNKSVGCISNLLPKVKLFTLIRNLTAAIKRFGSRIEEPYFVLIESIVGLYHNEKCDNYITGLALAVEQIPPNIGPDSMTNVLEKISELDEEISYRHESWLDDQWYVFFDAPNVPIADIRSGNTVSERVVAALTAILIFRQKKFLEGAIGRYGWKRIGLIIQTLEENECRKHDIQIPSFEKDWPIMLPTFTQDKFRNGKFTPIIVSSSYLAQADNWKCPDNKNIICLNLQVVNEIIKHFTRESCPEKILRKVRINVITETFDIDYKTKRK